MSPVLPGQMNRTTTQTEGYARWAEAAAPEGTAWTLALNGYVTELPTHDIDWLALNHDFSGGSF